jgi:hypothetical protein
MNNEQQELLDEAYKNYVKSFFKGELKENYEGGGHELVLEDWNDVSMDHEILKGKGKNRHYIDNEVLGLAGIHLTQEGQRYPEAINIVIERLEDQPLIEETIEEQTAYSEA